MIGKDRRLAFEAMLLSGIWIVIMLGFGKKPWIKAAEWRAAVITYFDYHGAQGADAKRYRREQTFPDLEG